ncbi:hypothetical protein AOQ84DRAFT_220341 [Glonium stellatum]|uniref:PD-(D/E)XK nuclease-like domain-containing protein n=1 Tax=Glonium stellatum TaxID=574774 RepID=A0A8E2F4I2_9PEZI|nr:hypothetical protein AOQ84DRAFT_220341 [Glonium stellatum]
MTERTPSPRKRKRTTAVEIFEELDVLEQIEELGLMDETPKAPKSSLPDDASSVSSSRSSRSSQASHRGRSTVKKLSHMRLNLEPIVPKNFSDTNEFMPPELEEMLRKMVRISNGNGVLAKSSLGDIRSKDDDRAFIGIEDNAFEQKDERMKLGPTPSAACVSKVLRIASKCKRRDHCEASWNSAVHAVILDMALDDIGYDVDFLNCTAAQISPKSLLPSTKSGHNVESKMIDFAIHLEPEAVFADVMRKLTVTRPTPLISLNQTHHPSLRYTPISVSIETKLTGQDWTKAEVQVGIWVAAQFKKLEEDSAALGGEALAPPFLPIIIVQGHSWNFLAATRGPGPQTNIWSNVTVGSTESALGVYKIVAALQLLAQWSDTVYRGWLYANVFGLQQDERSPAINLPIPDNSGLDPPKFTKSAASNGSNAGGYPHYAGALMAGLCTIFADTTNYSVAASKGIESKESRRLQPQ